MIERIKTLARSGPIALAAGLGALGFSSYLFLLLSGRQLGDETYAPLGTLWVLIFLLAPAFFYPIEQEVSRAVASRRAQGQGVTPVFERAAAMTAIIVIALSAVATATSPLYNEKLFNGQWLLFLGLIIAFVAFAAEYCLKGLLAGSGRLHAYGLLITVEGVVRSGVAIAFVVGGALSAAPFAIAIGLASLVGVVVVAPGKNKLLADGPPSAWRELSASLGNLVVASLLSQALTNAAPLVVKYFADASQEARAGAFVKAVVITRIPIFLFQAVQAILLPKLTHYATTGERDQFNHTLRVALLAVGVIGALGCVGAAIAGPALLTLFGSDYQFARSDVVLLAAGNALLLLCLTVAQALISVHRQSATVFGWAAGVVAFAASYALPGNIVTRSELALTIGAAVSLAALYGLLLKTQRFTEQTAPTVSR